MYVFKFQSEILGLYVCDRILHVKQSFQIHIYETIFCLQKRMVFCLFICVHQCVSRYLRYVMKLKLSRLHSGIVIIMILLKNYAAIYPVLNKRITDKKSIPHQPRGEIIWTVEIELNIVFYVLGMYILTPKTIENDTPIKNPVE